MKTISKLQDDAFASLSALTTASASSNDPSSSTALVPCAITDSLTTEDEFPNKLWVDILQSRVTEKLRHGVVAGYTDGLVHVKHDGFDYDLAWGRHQLIRSPIYDAHMISADTRKTGVA